MGAALYRIPLVDAVELLRAKDLLVDVTRVEALITAYDYARAAEQVCGRQQLTLDEQGRVFITLEGLIELTLKIENAERYAFETAMQTNAPAEAHVDVLQPVAMPTPAMANLRTVPVSAAMTSPGPLWRHSSDLSRVD
jgi:hypothetical protein